ncbi:MAG: DUF3467 domain-containing protein [Deltaproteobacteria bacterium]|nr:DUF3467 domain-containing protein [Deltaproteobacteria bacterium]
MSSDPHQINVEFPKEMVGGVYANNMAVTHTAEEFIMDYIMIAPPAGVVKSRVVVSPGHMKRIILALQENLEQYEQKFGSVQMVEEPGGEMTIQ